ncbi:hypothetical protein JT163_07330 [Helicobacter pylori]|nr:hypothetical protein [Helicobacter pylori]
MFFFFVHEDTERRCLLRSRGLRDVKKTHNPLWLETLQNLVASEFFELEDAINFGQELENANPNYQQKIANATGLALKNKKEKG